MLWYIVLSEEWVAAIRYVSLQLSAGGTSAAATGALPESDDRDMAQLGTSFRDPRRIVSTYYHRLHQIIADHCWIKKNKIIAAQKEMYI